MYVDRYDDAVDKQDYYSDIHDKLTDTLLAIQELGDPSFDVEAIEDAMDYASTKLREYRDLVDELGKEERKRDKYGIEFADVCGRGVFASMGLTE